MADFAVSLDIFPFYVCGLDGPIVQHQEMSFRVHKPEPRQAVLPNLAESSPPGKPRCSVLVRAPFFDEGFPHISYGRSVLPLQSGA